MRAASLEDRRSPEDRELRRRALAGPSARSLLFTILGEYVFPTGGVVWTATLMRALRVLGVEEKASRQAMARAALDGFIERERIGRHVRWRLTDPGRALLRQGAERIYSFGEPLTDWDGRWVVLVTHTTEISQQARHRSRTRLTWAGFGRLAPGVWVAARPERPERPEREEEARRVLEETGLLGSAVSFVGDLGSIGDEAEIVSAAWDLDGLEQRYEEFITDFAGSAPADPVSTFEASTRLVHEWRKFPFLDPGLPQRLLPSDWSGIVAHDLFHDRHAAWGDQAAEWFADADPTVTARAVTARAGGPP